MIGQRNAVGTSGRRPGGYSASKWRLGLLAILLAAGLFLLTQGADAQTPPTPPTPAAGTATGERPKAPGILQMIPNDFVTWTIGALSFVAVTLIVQGFIKTRASVYMPPASVASMRDMISNRQFKELIEFTETDPSFVAAALNPALKRAPSFSAMKEALETAVGEHTANSFRKIEYLNIIGNMGPLLGLLGTVLGMIQAFGAVQAAGGQADVGVLSGGIATALAHTFLGLGLAIPCLAAFGILRTLTDRLTVEASLKAEELLLMTKPPEGKPAGAPGTAPTMAAPLSAGVASPVVRPAPTPGVGK